MSRLLPGLALLLVVLAWAVPTWAADAPSATPEQLAALDEILARPEFQVAEGRSALDRWLDPVRVWLRWLMSEIARLLLWLLDPIAQVDGQPILYLILGVALLVLVGATLMVRRLLRGTMTDAATVTDAVLSGPPRAADELARARAAAHAGQSRRAVHHQYRAVLLRLDERDHLPFDGTLTNRELVPRLSTAPELAEPFADLVGQFDRLWYGQTDCSAEEYAAFAALSDRVWQAAGSVAPAQARRSGSSGPAAVVGAASGAR